MPNPYSPAWTISFTLRKALRSWIKPKDERRPDIIAEQVVADLRQSNWHLIKGPSTSSWEFDPTAIGLRNEKQRKFDEMLKALDDLARSTETFPIKSRDTGK